MSYVPTDEEVKKYARGETGYIPGAFRVIFELCEAHGQEAIDVLEKSGIKGDRLWALYADCCNYNAGETFKSLKDGTAAQKLAEDPWL